jgi:hypothetical protein
MLKILNEIVNSREVLSLMRQQGKCNILFPPILLLGFGLPKL